MNMADPPPDARDVLRSIWAVEGQRASFDEDCGPTKSCRNMTDVSFDGLAEPGSDLGAAWRDTLFREGKLRPSAPTVRDLVLGDPDADG